MVHAALLLLMLEAANGRPRFTISLKRSTQNLQLSTSRRPITSSLAHFPDSGHKAPSVRKVRRRDLFDHGISALSVAPSLIERFLNGLRSSLQKHVVPQ